MLVSEALLILATPKLRITSIVLRYLPAEIRRLKFRTISIPGQKSTGWFATRPEFFILNTVGCFCIMVQVDRIGRRQTLWVASAIVIVCLVSAILLDNWYARMILLGIAYGCEGCFSNIFNVLLSESACKHSISFLIQSA